MFGKVTPESIMISNLQSGEGISNSLTQKIKSVQEDRPIYDIQKEEENFDNAYDKGLNSILEQFKTHKNEIIKNADIDN